MTPSAESDVGGSRGEGKGSRVIMVRRRLAWSLIMSGIHMRTRKITGDQQQGPTVPGNCSLLAVPLSLLCDVSSQ